MKVSRLNTLLAALGLWAAATCQAADSGVIFMYHHFGDNRHFSTNTPLETFDAHLAYLAQEDFHVWPLEKLAAALLAGEPVPDRTVAITIDDAYQSIYTEAYPRLKNHGFPFTVFVATDAVDNGYGAYLNWNQIREMQGTGATFANHTASHDHLLERRDGETAAAWKARIIDDVSRAQRRLEEELGSAPRLFAYPYGEYSAELAKLLQQQGYVAFGQQSGPMGRTSDPRALPRFPASGSYAEIADFRLKANTVAMPVLHVEPSDPLVSGDTPPRITVTLASDAPALPQLACYASGQGKMQVRWTDGKEARFETQAQSPLPMGRSRYNCTARVPGEHNRYFWFSQPWIRVR